ncbi:hypothetical protein MPSEU_000607800 [Mayamaea pseudoterrestris]|nr:hypothetical protein MPSEU_000607800 [Mayamaea pseudoterrestris]
MTEEETQQRLILSPEDAMDDFDTSSEDENKPPRPPGRAKAPRPSMVARQSLATKRRRRSSMIRNRLSLTSANGTTPSEQHLGELYRKAIRMNAENRINAQNSWNLPLIEHIDKFLEEDEEEGEEENHISDMESSQTPKASKRVNFTKASCTLDASVKIYSFRVDDVHLTSYKVLANLNRNQKPNEKDGDDGIFPTNHDDEGDETATKTPARKTARSAQTLETNRANINLNRLDAAFDIDPLFHKMSKNFDEGGAKGLLLANLHTKNCSIVFDSSEEEGVTAFSQPEPESVDISSLQNKLESTLEDQPLVSMPLVPQLASLRAEFEILLSQGFVVADSSLKSKRFQPSADEEELADKSIHQEALERSTRTPAKSVMRDVDDSGDFSEIRGSGIRAFQITPQGEFAADEYGADDFGGGGDDYDDDHFVNFIAQEQRYSGISFSAGSRIDDGSDGNPFGDDDKEPSPTTVLLDALSNNNNNLLSQSNYSYLNEKALSRVENLWAGATHWKPARKNGRQTATAQVAAKKKKGPRKKASKERTFVCFAMAPDLSGILQKPPQKKRGANPLLMSAAMIKKHAANLNLLPLDAGIGIAELTKLFLRPDAVVSSSSNAHSADGILTGGPSKSVAFDMTAHDPWGDGGDDDDGTGFAMNNDDSIDENQDFCIRELDDVRRVEKVRVGYATVAKKVDVKKLKRDLWKELEDRFSSNEITDDEDMVDDERVEETLGVGVSFQHAVQELEQRKTQPDATLSFYFISILHLANEKGLRLESKGLCDFEIYQDKNFVGGSI